MSRRLSERRRWVRIASLSSQPTPDRVREAVAAIEALQKVGRVVRAEPDGFGGLRFLARRGG